MYFDFRKVSWLRSLNREEIHSSQRHEFQKFPWQSRTMLMPPESSEQKVVKRKLTIKILDAPVSGGNVEIEVDEDATFEAVVCKLRKKVDNLPDATLDLVPVADGHHDAVDLTLNVSRKIATCGFKFKLVVAAAPEAEAEGGAKAEAVVPMPATAPAPAPSPPPSKSKPKKEPPPDPFSLVPSRWWQSDLPRRSGEIDPKSPRTSVPASPLMRGACGAEHLDLYGGWAWLDEANDLGRVPRGVIAHVPPPSHKPLCFRVESGPEHRPAPFGSPGLRLSDGQHTMSPRTATPSPSGTCSPVSAASSSSSPVRVGGRGSPPTLHSALHSAPHGATPVWPPTLKSGAPKSPPERKNHLGPSHSATATATAVPAQQPWKMKSNAKIIGAPEMYNLKPPQPMPSTTPSPPPPPPVRPRVPPRPRPSPRLPTASAPEGSERGGTPKATSPEASHSPEAISLDTNVISPKFGAATTPPSKKASPTTPTPTAPTTPTPPALFPPWYAPFLAVAQMSARSPPSDERSPARPPPPVPTARSPPPVPTAELASGAWKGDSDLVQSWKGDSDLVLVTRKLGGLGPASAKAARSLVGALGAMLDELDDDDDVVARRAAWSELFDAQLVPILCELLRCHAEEPKLVAMICRILAQCDDEALAAQAADAGGLEALTTTLLSAKLGAGVLRWAAAALLTLTHGSVSRSAAAIQAGAGTAVAEALRALAESKELSWSSQNKGKLPAELVEYQRSLELVLKWLSWQHSLVAPKEVAEARLFSAATYEGVLRA